jgi:hypothetical protein
VSTEPGAGHTASPSKVDWLGDTGSHFQSAPNALSRGPARHETRRPSFAALPIGGACERDRVTGPLTGLAISSPRRGQACLRVRHLKYASAHTCRRGPSRQAGGDHRPNYARSQAEGGERPEAGSRAGRAMRSWPAPGLQLRSPKGGQRSLRHLSRAYAARRCERARPSLRLRLPRCLLPSC